MQLTKIARRFVAAATLALTAAVPALAQSNVFPGGVGSGSTAQTVNWVYDTGADVSLVPLGTAVNAGLVPGGVILVNGAPALCFPNTPVGCIDSFAQLCTTTTTVYSFLGPNPIGGVCLLGRDARRKLNGTWNDGTETLRWGNPGPLPPLAAALGLTFSSISGMNHAVLESVKMGSGSQSSAVPMTVLSGSNRSFIPLSKALELNPVIVGVVDLAATDINSLISLYVSHQNPTIQTVFVEIEVDGYDLGLGINHGPARLLVSADENSEFGAIGRDLLPSTDDATFRLHEQITGETFLSLSPAGK